MRAFKTRSQAAAACRAGSVSVDGVAAKPAREVREDETVVVRDGLLQRTLRVRAHPASRVGAKLVADYCTDLTPPDEVEKVRTQRVQQFLARGRGTGRPTKRDRRLLDEVFRS